ncbi:MAG: sugar transferase [Clostridiales bacterium]|nr:sugar transferase [Clostridiales bacterium]
MNKRKKMQRWLEFFAGIVSLFFAQLISYICFHFGIWIFSSKVSDYNTSTWAEYSIVLAVSYLVVFLLFSSPINLLKRSKPMEIASALRDCTLTYALFGTLLILTKNDIIESRYQYLGSFILFAVFSIILRYIIKRILLSKLSNSKFATITGIITTYDRAQEFIPRLQTDWSKNVKAVALADCIIENDEYKYIDKNNGSRTSVSELFGVPVVANMENVLGWIRTAPLDEVYINLPLDEIDNIADLVEEIENMGITVNINLPSVEKIVKDSKFDNFNCIVKSGYPMAVFSPTDNKFGVAMAIMKRAIDIVGGLVGTVVSLPIILIVAIPLLIESPGPLIFKQQRVGKNGRIFNIYKLRSMYPDAEKRKQELMEKNKMDGFMFKMDEDPRITKVGKFIRKYSIDELPQFWNVLKGDMSLVGTRPPTLDEFEQYESHHKRRLSMKPGITGNWQVSGRSDIQDFEKVVKLDCDYIDNWSLGLDIKILFKTIGVVLTHKGAE